MTIATDEEYPQYEMIVDDERRWLSLRQAAELRASLLHDVEPGDAVIDQPGQQQRPMTGADRERIFRETLRTFEST